MARNVVFPIVRQSYTRRYGWKRDVVEAGIENGGIRAPIGYYAAEDTNDDTKYDIARMMMLYSVRAHITKVIRRLT
jgi:hypothetical protein